MSALAYRPDIDGLRAVAVVAVIVFHMNPSWLPGGYLGVDVFFVISGYLITAIIAKGLAKRAEGGTGGFDWKTFYARRARRLLPALLLVVGFVAAVITTLPEEIAEPARGSVLASLAFVANWFFFHIGDYFGPTAETQPLLHIWSLGVEEQFYIVVPVLLWLAYRWQGVKGCAVLVGAITAVSFAVSAWQAVNSPELAFYGTHSRAWQIGMGSLLALLPGVFAFARAKWAAVAGLVLIALGIAFGGTLTQPVPAAIPTCLGALLVIGSGGSAGLGSKILSIAPMVWIGLRSYGLYLWHWPLFVFGRLLFPELGEGGDVLAVALAVAVSALSYAVVEQPVRTRRALSSSRLAAGAALVSVSGIVALAVVPPRLPSPVTEPAPTIVADIESDDVRPPAIDAATFESELVPRRLAAFMAAGRRTCWMHSEESVAEALADPRCLALDPDRANVLVVGDSHSANFHAQLEAAFPGIRFSLVAANSCALLDMIPNWDKRGCKQIHDYTFSEDAQKYDAILLAPRLQKKNIKAYVALLDRLVERAEPEIVLIGPLPYYDPSLHVLYPLHAAKAPEVRAARFNAAVDESHFESDGILEAFAAAHDRVSYASPMSVVCPEGPSSCEHMGSDGWPVTMDASHFTPVATRDVLRALRADGQLEVLEGLNSRGDGSGAGE